MKMVAVDLNAMAVRVYAFVCLVWTVIEERLARAFDFCLFYYVFSLSFYLSVNFYHLLFMHTAVWFRSLELFSFIQLFIYLSCWLFFSLLICFFLLFFLVYFALVLRCHLLFVGYSLLLLHQKLILMCLRLAIWLLFYRYCYYYYFRLCFCCLLAVTVLKFCWTCCIYFYDSSHAQIKFCCWWFVYCCCFVSTDAVWICSCCCCCCSVESRQCVVDLIPHLHFFFHNLLYTTNFTLMLHWYRIISNRECKATGYMWYIRNLKVHIEFWAFVINRSSYHLKGARGMIK